MLRTSAAALALMALVVLVLLVEGATRVAYYTSSRRFVHPFLGETQKPLHQRIDVTPEGDRFVFTTNNYGFRGADIPERKPAGARYIFALGGSTTACNEYPHEMTWPGLLEQRLRRRYGDDRIHVFNAGMGTATSYHSLVMYSNLIAELEPDLVLVYEGVNDNRAFYPSSARYFREVGNGEDFLQRPSYLLYELALNTRSTLLTRAARSLYPAALPRKGFEYHEKNYRQIAYLASGYRTPLVFITQPVIPNRRKQDGNVRESNDRINESTRGLGQQLNVPVFDLAAVMPLDDEHFLADGVHYTKAGNATIATKLADWLVQSGLP
jgi:lysophospholipase L1-like esterase